MWSFFKKKNKVAQEPVTDFSFLGCDMHSHLVPGIDDGAATMEDSLALIRGLRALGYRKLITTPHVYGEFYNNTPETILPPFEALKQAVAAEGIDVELEVAAEYFLDLYFLSSVLPGGLLSFGGDKKYVLVEVSMAGWPRIFDEIIFAIQSQGYTPVLAHPERYGYEESVEFFRGLKDRGILLQLNLLSILGYYGPSIRNNAFRYLDNELYELCGSDVHHERHLRVLGEIAERSQLLQRLKGYSLFRNACLVG
jgi:protein-tyrosine phosphatase